MWAPGVGWFVFARCARGPVYSLSTGLPSVSKSPAVKVSEPQKIQGTIMTSVSTNITLLASEGKRLVAWEFGRKLGIISISLPSPPGWEPDFRERPHLREALPRKPWPPQWRRGRHWMEREYPILQLSIGKPTSLQI